MRERIQKFIDSEHISSAKFADEIKVQRSSISHILSGRNNPSFDFIQKVLARYKSLNAEWLIMGSGPMYKDMAQGSLFDLPPSQTNISEQKIVDAQIINPQHNQIPIIESGNVHELSNTVKSTTGKKVEKIVIFYTDKTFSSYSPES